MRKLGHLLMALLCLALLAPLVYWGAHTGLQLFNRVTPPADATPVRSFQLEQAQWTRYNLPRRAIRLRVLATAGLAPQPTPVLREAAFEYRLLDKRGEVLAQRTLAFVARPVGASLSEGLIRTTPYLPLENIRPHGDQDYFIDLADMPQARELQLRLNHKDQDIAWVAARVAFRIQRSEKDSRLQWRRLRKEQQNELADPSIIPVDLLYPDEKYALLQQAWEPLGPQGVANQDYRELRLYRLNTTTTSGSGTALPPGRYLDDWHWSTVALSGTAADGTLLLRHGAPESLLPARVETEFFPDTPSPQQAPVTGQLTVPVTGEPIPVPHPDEPGLLLLKSTTAVQLSQKLASEPAQAPDSDFLTLWQLTPGESLSYRVHHQRDTATPLRLDLRTVLPASQARVRYRGTDRDGTTLLEGRLDHNGEPSHFERLMPFLPSQRVTDASRHYLEVPARVTQMTLSTDQPVFINGFSRPRDLPHARQVPAITGEEDTLPAWFTVAPQQSEALHASRHTLLWHKRPPLESPEQATEPQYWEDFQPLADTAVAKRLYIPRMTSPQDSPALKAALFHPLRQGANRLTLAGRDGSAPLRPELLLLRDSAAPGEIDIRLDGQPLRRQPVAGRVLRLTLPAMAAGRHTLEVRGLRGSAFMNSLAQAPGTVPDSATATAKTPLLPRLAWQIPEEGLRFTLDKQAGEELVNLQLFSRDPDAEARTLTVTLESANRDYPSPGYSFRQRRFRVTALPGNAVAPVELTQGAGAGLYHRVVFPLAADLPPGPVTVRLTSSGDDTLVLVSRVTRGASDRFRLFSEEVLTP
ncbi:MAG: hypothetical protein R3296_02755 [Oleiphilaceae bacterium]|nr:hypothetical protein [Oleiphilaceae bacterium]